MKKLWLVSILSLVLALSACTGEVDNTTINTDDTLSGIIITETITEEEILSQLDTVLYNLAENGIDFDSYDDDLEGSITLSSSTETMYITEGGTYVLSGEYTTQLEINVVDEDVNIILNNVTMSSLNGPCILVLDAQDVTISAPEGTVNTLEDSLMQEVNEYDSVIYSYSDLELNGTGTINITAVNNNAIYSKDDIKVSEVELNIISVDDGIIGRDYVALKNTTITIESDGDAIKSTNDEDVDKGFVYVVSGTYNFNTGGDGIQAINDVIIYNGTFTIDVEDDGIQSSNSIYIGNGVFNITSGYDGLKAVVEIYIFDGVINISAADDGIHSDDVIVIEGGTIVIETSYEGIEAYSITFNNGNITVNSTDDGINATTGGGQEHGPQYTSTGGFITINGGVIQVNAITGDGVDVNGNGLMTGGYLIIYGPTADNQSAIDYDQTFDITGGVAVSIGSTGMIQSFSDTSTQASLLYADTTSYSAGTLITLYDESGNTLVEVESIKSFTGVVLSTNEMEMDEAYTLELGSDTFDFEISNIVTTLGSGGSIGQGTQPPGRR